MKKITWNPEKAIIFRNSDERGGISFEDCVIALEEGRVLADIPHPSKKYEHQHILVLEINNYAYVVPYAETVNEIFLKTVFPSRKHTNLLIPGRDDEQEA